MDNALLEAGGGRGSLGEGARGALDTGVERRAGLYGILGLLINWGCRTEAYEASDRDLQQIQIQNTRKKIK